MVCRVRFWSFVVVLALAVLAAVVQPVPVTAEEAAVTSDSTTAVASPEPPPPADIFVPGPARTGPPDQTAPAAGGRRPHRSAGAEVVELRSESSRTFVSDQGAYETVFSSTPVNFRNDNGQWEPIDNTLVTDQAPGDGYRNRANRFQVGLPSALGVAPVRVADGQRWVDLSLLQPATGTDPAAARQAARSGPVAVVGSTARYPEAFPGVDVVYTVTAAGLKEELVLAGPPAVTEYDFAVSLAPGLSARQDGNTVALVTADGTEWARLDAPFMYDQAHLQTGAPGGYSDAVTLTVVQQDPLVLRLSADAGWLADPARVWPVVLDPTVTWATGINDTRLESGSPDSNYLSSSLLRISGGTSKARSLVFFDVATFFASPVVIGSADLNLHATNSTSGTAQAAAAYRITSNWNQYEVTWNSRRTGYLWSTPGGDYASTPAVTNPNVIGGPGVRTWPVASFVQAWADGTAANYGVLIRYVDESAGPAIELASRQHTDSTKLPELVVHWLPVHGDRGHHTTVDFELGERRQARINVASGAFDVTEQDLRLAGTGLDATVARTYSSGTDFIRSAGARWSMWPQAPEGISPQANGDVMWWNSPFGPLRFNRNADGSFTSPPGFRGSLVKAGDGTYSVTMHTSSERFNFWSGGQPRSHADRNGNTVSFSYSGSDLASMTDTRGRMTTFTRATAGGPVTGVVDPASRQHTYTYDTSTGEPRLTKYTDPAGKATSYAYDGTTARLARIIDPNGNNTLFEYDTAGRLSRMIRVTSNANLTGATWTFDYSVAWQTKVTDPNNRTTTYNFDRRGRVTSTVDARGKTHSGTWDANNNSTSSTDQMSAATARTYDTNNNLTGITAPASASGQTAARTTFTYPSSGLKYLTNSSTDPQGRCSSYVYDTKGNTTDVYAGLTPSGSPPTCVGLTGTNRTTQTYNADGTIATRTDPNGIVTAYTYTGGKLTGINHPAPLGDVSVAYDSLDRVSAVTDGKGQITRYSYDTLDRVTQILYNGATSCTSSATCTTFTYDAAGRLTARADNTGTTNYAYDTLNRVTKQTLPGGANACGTQGGMTYSYNLSSDLIGFCDASGTTNYNYNETHLAISLAEPGGNCGTTPVACTRFGYDDVGRRTSTTYPNGVTQTITYNSGGHQTSITAKLGTTTLTGFTYTSAQGTSDRTLRQTVTVAHEANNTVSYSYDTLNRLTGATTKNSAGTTVDTRSWAYDQASNRTSQTINGTTTSYTYNAANQLTGSGGVTYTYDGNGNQIGTSAGQAISYNPKNQSTSIKRAGGTAVAMTYAGLDQTERTAAGGDTYANGLLGVGRQTGTATTYFIRDPYGNLVAQRSGTTSYYYLFDGLGSIVALTDPAGNIVRRYTYDPYGNITTTTGTVDTPWRYAGGYHDTTTGLTKFGTRYYDPTLGRWTQMDPLPGTMTQARTLNRYTYVGGDPVNYTDPTGLASIGDAFDAVGKLADVAEVAGAFLTEMDADDIVDRSTYATLAAVTTGALVGTVCGVAAVALTFGTGSVVCIPTAFLSGLAVEALVND